MSKLLKYTEWVTIKNAAKHLSTTLGEKFTKADILRLALDRHLTLSVYFVNHVSARRGQLVPFHETNWALISAQTDLDNVVLVEGEASEPAMTAPWKLQKLLNENPESIAQGFTPIMTSIPADAEKDLYLNLEEDVFHIRGGVWDLPLIGNERLDVEDQYQQQIKGPTVDILEVAGALICDNDYYYQIQELDESIPGEVEINTTFKFFSQLAHGKESSGAIQVQHQIYDRDLHRNHYIPAEGLPDDCELVVRTSALREFEEKWHAEDRPPEKSLHPSERKSTAQIIAALAAMAKLDLSTHYSAEQTLRVAAAQYGLELPASPETVVKFLKAAADTSKKS